MGPISSSLMMLAGVAMQAYNNFANNEQSSELRKLHKDMQKAAKDVDFEHMRKIHERTIELSRELDESAHLQRMQDIEQNYDEIIKQIANEKSYENWPISVLPLVMRGDSFGAYIGGGARSVAMHCVFTPSNDAQFNELIFNDVDFQLEALINDNWNTNGRHQIIYYGGSWPSYRGVPGRLEDLNDIDTLRYGVSGLPTLVITPWFNPTLSFRIRIWGISSELRIPEEMIFMLNEANIVNEKKQKIPFFSHEYVSGTFPLGEFLDDFVNTSIEEFVQCLMALIGVVSDHYFWSRYHELPLFPTVYSKLGYSMEVVSTYVASFKKMLSKLADFSCIENGFYLLEEYLKSSVMPFDPILYNQLLEDLYLEACKVRGKHFINCADAIIYAAKEDLFLPGDTKFLKAFSSSHSSVHYKNHRINRIKIANNTKRNIRMDAKIYSQKRDDLITLINRILDVQGLEQNEKDEFVETRRRLREDQFNIVLIGEFQGGKSTTFNALCDGREISPRGCGIKTSAIRITASNISDSSVAEYALVEWKTDAELLKMMSLCTKMMSADDLGVTLKENEVFSLEKYFDFSNETHLSVLKDAIDSVLLTENTYGLSQEEIAAAEENVRISKLILSFYSNSLISSKKESSNYSINDVAKLATFPLSWEQKWYDIARKECAITDVFVPEEAIFAFVKEIHCFIHSANLARLGCSITDCPGLFASEWDTSVALSSISKANAVLYLLGGERQMTDGDKKAISRIFVENSFRKKVFFTFNKRHSDKITQQLMLADEAILKSTLSMYPEVDPKIMEMNSLLFFLSEIGSKILSGEIDEFSNEQFIKFCEINGFEGDTIIEQWNDILLNIAICTKDVELKGKELSAETLSVAKAHSHSESVLSHTENSIIEQRAHSILIDNGACRVLDCLEQVESRLTLTEDAAKKSVEECEAEYTAAQNAYNSFKAKVEMHLSKAFSTDLEHQIAQNAYMQITRSEVLDKIGMQLAIDIPKAINLKCKGNAVWQSFMNVFAKSDGKGFAAEQRDKAKKKIKDVIEPVIKSAVEGELSSTIKIWESELRNGSHYDYINNISPRLVNLSEEINKEWETAIKGNLLLEEIGVLSIPTSGPLPSIDVRRVSSDESLYKIAGQHAMSSIVKDVVIEVVAIVTATIVSIIIDLIFFGGLGTIITVLATGYTYVAIKLGLKKEDPSVASSLDDLSKDQLKFYNKVRPNLGDKFLSNDTRDKLIESLMSTPHGMFDSFCTYYRQQLNDRKNTLQNKISLSRERKQKSLDEQMRIAMEAKNIRERQINPLLSDVTVFIESCKE